MSYFWTSEAVAAGHPDKVADQVADAILDANLLNDPMARVAAEVTLTSNTAILTGEVTSANPVHKKTIERVVRKTVCRIGYDREENSFNGSVIEIVNMQKQQSDEISKAVTRADNEIGAGDQGIMFGYATNESPDYTPLTHWLSFQAIKLLEADIEKGRQEAYWLSPFLPDAKSQVTILYDDNGKPKVDNVLISACHRSDVSLADLQFYVQTKILNPLMTIAKDYVESDSAKFFINPAGAWSIGGPESDTGLSGRKIVVDSYGADCPVGGGSFSGKDPTKVDRSAAYAARYVAKNIVAAGLTSKCQLQLAYAIGVVEPVSVRIQTFGELNIQKEKELNKKIIKLMSFRPKSIIERFGLRNPIGWNYEQTAAGGHFGRSEFPWEQLDLAKDL